MSESYNRCGFSLDQISSVVESESIYCLNHGAKDVSNSPLRNCDRILLSTMSLFSQLPSSSWLHLSTVDNQLVFILSQKLSPDETIFLTFPPTTRISELKAKLALLNDCLASPNPDPSAALVRELSSSDLKAGASYQPRSDNFLSIFSDLEKSGATASSTPPNLSDTQPISI